MDTDFNVRDLINPRHSFWSTTTGSNVSLMLEGDSCLTMSITVNSISEPTVYKIIITQTGFESTTTFFTKKETLKLIKNNWMKYYEDRTIVQYNEHKMIQLDNFKSVNTILLTDSDSGDEQVNDDRKDNTKETKTSFKSKVESILELLSPRSNNSSRDSSPRYGSPRGDGSPRYGSPRRRLQLRSLHQSPRNTNSPRSTNISPRTPSSNEGSPRYSLSPRSSPRESRTPRLLRKASYRLASKSPKHTSNRLSKSDGFDIG